MATMASNLCRDLFFQRLSCDRAGILALDFDGTIAPLTPKRQAAFPYPGVRRRLQKIMRAGSEIVIVSGRHCSEVSSLLQLDSAPEIYGCHGAERLHAGASLSRIEIPVDALESLQMAAEWLEQEGASDCLEVKYGAVCVHWRGRSDLDIEALRTVASRVFDVCRRREELMMVEFDGGLELRYVHARKSGAIRSILSRGAGRCIAYCGDDVTDEDAFRELNGSGLTVLVRPTLRATHAMLWLTPPDELEDFLDEWLDCCGGAR